MPHLNEELAREVASSLFKSFFELDPYAQLTALEVCFLHQEKWDRGQTFDVQHPIWIRRLERDHAPSPVDGGFTIESQGKWDHLA